MNTNTKVAMSMLCVLLAACEARDEASRPGTAAELRVADAALATHDDEREHAVAESHVQLTQEQIENAGLVLVPAGPASIRETLPLYGVIVPNAERVRDVAARFPGVIETVRARVGDTLRAGDTLATVESNESLQTYAITAPLSGTITARNANAGEQTGDRILFTVVDLASVWVEIALFPRDVSKVFVGQQVHVRAAGAERMAEGKVVYVAPFGSSTSQTVTARVLLDNEARLWSPGLYVVAEADLAHHDVPLAVERGALQTLDERTVVFVHGERGFEPRAVQTGHADSERSEIVKGLRAGEVYVAKNSFILKAELGKGSAEHEH